MTDFKIDMGKMNDPNFRASVVSQVNGMISLASDKLLCDDACQFERKANELKQKWERAGEVKQDIPTIYTKREKDYIVFTKGIPYYNEMMADRYEATGKEILKKMLEKHKFQMKLLQEELETYANGTLYEQNIRDLWKKYQQEEKKYKLATLKMKNNISISDRQSAYEDAETEKLKKTRNIVFFIYCFIVFVFLVYFIAKKRYTDKKIWLVLIFLLIFPFIKTLMLKSGTSIKDRIKSYFNNVYLEDDCDDCEDNENTNHNPAIADSL